MSLHSFIAERAEVRQGFAARLGLPPLRFKRGLRAPPASTNHQLVDIAFGYLLRFRLQKINPQARVSAWNAEAGAALIGMGKGTPKGKEVTTIGRHPRQLRAAAFVADAKRRCQGYVLDGRITQELLEAAHRMAHLDQATRSGPERIDWRAINYLRAGDAVDLKALLELVDDEAFKVTRTCILDPNLPAAELVGGGAPDFILDHCVVNVITAHEPRLDSRNFYRLVGCYLLLGLAGISDESGKPEQLPLTSVGIYFARYGHLWTVPFRAIAPPDALPDLTRWFVETACTANPDGRALLPEWRGPLAGHLKS
jgi:hypothetical protein